MRYIVFALALSLTSLPAVAAVAKKPAKIKVKHNTVKHQKPIKIKARPRTH